jgi:hypothetical protein
VATTLVSEDNIVEDDDVLSVNVSPSDPPSSPSYSRSAQSSSADLGAAFLPSDGSSGVQTLSQPSPAPQRSGRFLLMGAMFGMVIAGGAVLVARGRARSDVHEGGHAAATESPGAPAATAAPSSALGGPAQPEMEGQSLDSLPSEQDPTSGVRYPRQPGNVGANKANVEKLAHDMAAMRPDETPPAATGPTPAEKVTLTEEKDKARVSAIANGVNLDDHAAQDEAAHASEVTFDKAQAQQQLARAASQVGVCKRPGGETGPGRALVTLNSSGAPQSVTIQGKLSGTPAGECVAAQFRTVKIASFTGGPVTLAKGFRIPEE